MSDLLYAKERQKYAEMRTLAAALDRLDVVRACDYLIDFIDQHSPRLNPDQEDQ